MVARSARCSLRMVVWVSMWGLWAGSAVWAMTPTDMTPVAYEDPSTAGAATAVASDAPVAYDVTWERPSLLERWMATPPWKLPQPRLTQDLGIHIGGWLEGGFTTNADDPQSPYNAVLVANDRHGELQMHELWLFAERKLDTSKNGFDVGGRVDMFYGSDWRFASVHSYKWESQFNSEDQLYGLSIPQIYAEAGVNRLTVKMGHMASILGYEVLAPWRNFFYSHSYALVYSEPYLITGMMGKYELSEEWELFSGFHRGYHMFEDVNDNLNYQGGIRWTDFTQRMSVAYCMDYGRNDPAAQSPQYSHSLVFRYRFSPRLQYALQNDYGQTQNVALLDGGDATWYGINQYFIYTLNERWSAGMRAEWFRDADGTRVGGIGSHGYRGWESAGGYAGDFYELTMGLNWKPKANWWIRPEIRWDWYDGQASRRGPNPLPFDDGRGTDQLTLATDFIMTY